MNINYKTDEISKSYFREHIKTESPVIFDIGCYNGKDSLEFYELFSNPTIYAFEADKRSIELFKKNVGINKHIHLNDIALSDKNGIVEWYASDSKKSRHHVFQKNWPASSSIKKPQRHIELFKDIFFEKNNTVNSMCLDTWIKDREINFIDVMWVDVNGAEFEFIKGALQTINEKVRYLYIEFSATEKGEIYEGSLTYKHIIEMLDGFKNLGVYNFMGNFGNILLENKFLD